MSHPSQVMPNVVWDFSRIKAEQASFSEEVRKYQLEVLSSDAQWRPSAVVLEAPMVKVRYTHWATLEKQAEREIELRADNEASFTAVELLWKLHADAMPQLLNQDQAFFEGLVLTPGDEPTPRYQMQLSKQAAPSKKP
jgi:hypothetical protein